MDSQAFKAAVVELHSARSNVALVGLALTYGLMAGAVGLVATQPSASSWVGAYLLIGFMQYRLVLACHEAVHKAFLFPLWLNELSGVVSGALVGMNFTRYRKQHLDHHRAESIATDPDAYIYAPILQRPAGWPRAAAWLLGMGPEIIEKFRQKGLGGGADDGLAKRDSLAMLALNGLLFLVFWWAIDWWAYFALWLAPVLSVALFANRTRVYIEHAYCFSGQTWLEADLAREPTQTIDLTSWPVERFFMSGFSFNYHNAHHRSPTVSHFRLRQAMEVFEQGDPAYRQRVQATYVGTLWRMLRSAG
jgi:fatty acid desaturase